MTNNGQVCGGCLIILGIVLLIIGAAVGELAIDGLIALIIGIIIFVAYSYEKSQFPEGSPPQISRDIVVPLPSLEELNQQPQIVTAEHPYLEHLETEVKPKQSEDDLLEVAQDELDNNDAFCALQAEVKQLQADLTFDREVIAAKEARIAEQGKEIEQLKAFITKVSDRVAQPQTPTPSPLPQSKGRCVRCGFQNIREAKYCRQCGVKI